MHHFPILGFWGILIDYYFPCFIPLSLGAKYEFEYFSKVVCYPQSIWYLHRTEKQNFLQFLCFY